MNFRKISIVAGAAVIGFSVYFGLKIGEGEGKPSKAPVAKIQVVKALPVVNAPVKADISVTGKLEAVNRIEIYSEVSGIYRKTSKAFREGYHFSKGQLLIRIDSDEAYQNLLAQRSQLFNQITQMMPDLKIDYPEDFESWDTYLKGLDIKSSLKPLPEPATEKSRYFITSKNIYNQYYTVKGLEERLSKYFIHAPFSGVVAMSAIDPGTLVRQGQKLGEYISPDEYELVTNVSVKDLNFVKQGDKVLLGSSDIQGDWLGTITRISNNLDPATQTVKVFVKVKGKGLKEGMFLSGSIHISDIPDAESIPRNILMNNNEVFLIKDSLLKKTVIDVVRVAADSAIVKGLPNGAILLNESIPGAFEGMKVQAQIK